MAPSQTQPREVDVLPAPSPAGVSAKEAARRARQRTQATTPPNGEVVDSVPAPSFEQQVAMVNLDEVIEATVKVAFRVKQDDGSVGREIVDVLIEMPIDLTLEAAELKDRINDMPQYEMIRAMLGLVHRGLQLTRPTMTQAEMTFGLDTKKIIKLFTIFFG